VLSRFAVSIAGTYQGKPAKNFTSLPESDMTAYSGRASTDSVTSGYLISAPLGSLTTCTRINHLHRCLIKPIVGVEGCWDADLIMLNGLCCLTCGASAGTD
jgi:hypothetical protein